VWRCKFPQRPLAMASVLGVTALVILGALALFYLWLLYRHHSSKLRRLLPAVSLPKPLWRGLLLGECCAGWPLFPAHPTCAMWGPCWRPVVRTVHKVRRRCGWHGRCRGCLVNGRVRGRRLARAGFFVSDPGLPHNCQTHRGFQPIPTTCMLLHRRALATEWGPCTVRGVGGWFSKSMGLAW
jgi:hypothetical protein